MEEKKHVTPGCSRARVHLARAAARTVEEGDAREPAHDITAPIVATTVDDDDLVVGEGGDQTG